MCNSKLLDKLEFDEGNIMSIDTVLCGTIAYLKAGNIPVPNCFTTRIGGVSSGYLEGLNIGANRGDDFENVRENYRLLAGALGIDPTQMVLTRQTHSDIVRRVCSADHMGFDHRVYPECDALITNDPGTALVVFTADCTPVLLYDPVTGAVGAAHAGWRGTAAGIGEKTVRAMVEAFGCDPANIRAAIGPNIAQCCFETDGDVPKAMLEAYGDGAKPYIRPSGDKYYVNLKAINALSLQRAGVVDIEIAPHCTACDPKRFWSHRKMGAQRGSQGAVIVCKEASL